ncbi:hypothetical protein Aduo_004172 [Ancylostoma duodenale]
MVLAYLPQMECLNFDLSILVWPFSSRHQHDPIYNAMSSESRLRRRLLKNMMCIFQMSHCFALLNPSQHKRREFRIRWGAVTPNNDSLICLDSIQDQDKAMV